MTKPAKKPAKKPVVKAVTGPPAPKNPIVFKQAIQNDPPKPAAETKPLAGGRSALAYAAMLGAKHE